MYTTTETIRMHVFSTPFHGCGNDRNASFMELAFGCLGLDPEPPLLPAELREAGAGTKRYAMGAALGASPEEGGEKKFRI